MNSNMTSSSSTAICSDVVCGVKLDDVKLAPARPVDLLVRRVQGIIAGEIGLAVPFTSGLLVACANPGAGAALGAMSVLGFVCRRNCSINPFVLPVAAALTSDSSPPEPDNPALVQDVHTILRSEMMLYVCVSPRHKNTYDTCFAWCDDLGHADLVTSRCHFS